MLTVELFGRVNDRGELEIESLPGLHVGKRVKIIITELEDVPPEEHWGQNLVALLDQLDLSAWESEPIDDPVAWVKQQRQAWAQRRGLDWGQE